MRDALLNDKLISASPDSPDVAHCPVCGGDVKKRSRRNGKEATWFYRHVTGSDDCSRRYRPVPEG